LGHTVREGPLVEFWQALVIAAIPSAAAVISAFAAFRDLGMRRRLETSKQFLTLFATAHSRPTDGRDGAGVGEQIATIHLIADFAKRERLVRNAAKAGLTYFAKWDQPPATTSDEALRAVVAALQQNASEMPELMKKLKAGVTVISDGQREVAGAARAALKRLD
jgi:ABC-type branched-subunit amino acid transport system substrate-binding protein